ncbi:MAG TPA: hypothetical protein VGF24_01670 [Vicinamibacterales bacterium]
MKVQIRLDVDVDDDEIAAKVVDTGKPIPIVAHEVAAQLEWAAVYAMEGFVDDRSRIKSTFFVAVDAEPPTNQG